MFACRIFTLSQLFLQDVVYSVHLPGKDGDFEVYPNHVSLVQILRPGIIKLTKSQVHGPVMLYIFITGGLFILDGIKASVYASRAVSLADEREETLAHALEHFTYHELGASPLKV